MTSKPAFSVRIPVPSQVSHSALRWAFDPILSEMLRIEVVGCLGRTGKDLAILTGGGKARYAP